MRPRTVVCVCRSSPLPDVNSSTSCTSRPSTVLLDFDLMRTAPVSTGLDRGNGSVYFHSRTLTPPMLSQPLMVSQRPMDVSLSGGVVGPASRAGPQALRVRLGSPDLLTENCYRFAGRASTDRCG